MTDFILLEDGDELLQEDGDNLLLEAETGEIVLTTKLTVNAVEFNDYRVANIQKSMSEYTATSNFTITLDSPYGRHANDFNVGDEVVFFAEETVAGSANVKLITGIIEKISFKGKENTQTVTLSGRDFSLRFQDITVVPVVYTNTEISDIVKDIMANNVMDITVSNVDTTSVTLKRIAFNHITVNDALKQLAELAGFIFYVDEDKDLHFEEKNIISSGITLDNTNINKSTFNQTREGMSNSVWVYGDRYLAGFQETFTATNGSSYELLSKPRNTYVTVNGSPQVGGVLELTSTPNSGTNYLVSFNDKLIVFTSGTDIGNSIPVSGADTIITQYDRDIPIVKFGENKSSIATFGKKVKVINDKSINDPNTAVDILKTELNKADPFKGIEANIKGWTDFTVGDTVQVIMSDFGLDETVGILNVTYTFNKRTIQDKKVIKIRLDRKIKDITDEITDIRKRVEAIEAADRLDTDIITRLETSEDSLQVVGSSWEVRTRVLNNSFLLGTSALGSIVASGISLLGDQGDAFSTVRSGGFF